MEKKETTIIDILQVILFSTLIAFLLVAIAAFIFGESNAFGNSPFPSLGVIAITSFLLLRSD